LKNISNRKGSSGDPISTQSDKNHSTPKLTWESEDDKTLLQLVSPLSQLIRAKVSGKLVQNLLTRQNVLFCVEHERLYIKGQSTNTWSRPLQGVPDLVIVISKESGVSITASLTDDSRHALKSLANYGELSRSDKLTPLSRREFLIKYSISEDALENWCSFCGLDSDLSHFSAEQVARLHRYQALSSAGVAASELFELFNS